jgi:hypothetical protein
VTDQKVLEVFVAGWRYYVSEDGQVEESEYATQPFAETSDDETSD